jgi:hypothetical protein
MMQHRPHALLLSALRRTRNAHGARASLAEALAAHGGNELRALSEEQGIDLRP